jgi:hypothetical protein
MRMLVVELGLLDSDEIQWGTSARQCTTPPLSTALECGAAAVEVRTAPDCMMAVLHEDSFRVFPLRKDYHCTPQSVASHTLYENADPFELKESSGHVADEQRPIRGDLGSCSARFRVGIRAGPGIHDQIGRDAPYRIFRRSSWVGCATFIS